MDKKFLLPIILGMFLIFCSYNVFAEINITAPLNHSLNSGTAVFFNITFTNSTDGLTDPTTATFYYNSTNALYNWTEIGNVTCSEIGECSGNLDVSNVPEGIYEINATFWNATGQVLNATLGDASNYTASNITFDSIPPWVQVANFSSSGYFRIAGNYSKTDAFELIINITISNDTTHGFGNGTVGTVDFVYVNVTGSTNAQNATGIFNCSASSANNWNVTINASEFADGMYNITIYVNDSFGNINNSALAHNIVFDNNDPSAPTFSCNSSAVLLNTQATCTCSGTDGSGYYTTTYTASPSTSNTGTHTETCTIKDYVGRNKSSSASYTVVYSLAGNAVGGDSAGGGTTTTTWENTFVPTEVEFEGGFQKGLLVNERVKLSVSDAVHYVGVTEMTTTSATIEIASDPVTVQLDIGGEAKVDVDLDGSFYDVYVKLEAIANGKADIVIKKINEAIPTGGGPSSVEGATVTGGEIIPPEEKSYTWLYVVIGVVALIVIGSVVGVKKRKK